MIIKYEQFILENENTEIQCKTNLLVLLKETLEMQDYTITWVGGYVKLIELLGNPLNIFSCSIPDEVEYMKYKEEKKLLTMITSTETNAISVWNEQDYVKAITGWPDVFFLSKSTIKNIDYYYVSDDYPLFFCKFSDLIKIIPSLKKDAGYENDTNELLDFIVEKLGKFGKNDKFELKAILDILSIFSKYFDCKLFSKLFSDCFAKYIIAEDDDNEIIFILRNAENDIISDYVENIIIDKLKSSVKSLDYKIFKYLYDKLSVENQNKYKTLLSINKYKLH